MDSYHWGPLATAGSVSSLWQMASRRLSAHLSFWHDLSVLPLACGWAVLRLAQEQFHPVLEANFAYVRRWFLRLTKPLFIRSKVDKAWCELRVGGVTDWEADTS